MSAAFMSLETMGGHLIGYISIMEEKYRFSKICDSKKNIVMGFGDYISPDIFMINILPNVSRTDKLIVNQTFLS